MSKKLRELQAKRAKHTEKMRAITDAADKEGRDLTEAEAAEFDTEQKALASTNGAIEREQAMLEAERNAPAVAGHDDARIEGGEDLRVEDPKRGFKSKAEFFGAVRGATSLRRNGQAVDERLTIGASAPSTFGNEGAGADGGFLVPPEFSTEIFQFSLADNALLPFTDNVDIQSNSMVFPRDETTPWGTNGVRAYWQGEAAAGTPTKPVLGGNALRLKKLLGLVPVSDELAADANALASYLPKKIGMSIQWKTNEAILFGDGNGCPLGALKGNAALTVAKDSGQATNTLTAANLANMVARLPEGSFGNAIWLINNDALGALFTLTLGNYPIYLPVGVGGLRDTPYGMLLGRPVIISQHANTFSSLGDVNLLDLSYYQTITKAEGVQTATSMHLYFDADAMAFRTTFRIDGAPKITNQISPAKGSNKMSPFLQLQNR
jgi:HK97 family phage major capsid protein